MLRFIEGIIHFCRLHKLLECYQSFVPVRQTIINTFQFWLLFKVILICGILDLSKLDGKAVNLLKTFKMMSMTVVQEDQNISIPLIDGIIINQENSHRSWIIEMYVDKNDSTFFEKFEGTGEVMEVKIVISYPENEPASFEVAVYSVKKIGDYVSVLFKGTLKRIRRKYAEQLLAELITEGLSGEDLVSRFEKDMRNRPQLKKDSANV